MQWHRHDFGESVFAYVIGYEMITFVDLNNDEWWSALSAGRANSQSYFALPRTRKEVDWIVSMPNMKNLFDTLPGIFYGTPKNVLHVAGTNESIIDINLTLCPHFAIVDDIVSMEGDGLIMGVEKNAGGHPL